MKAKLSFAFAVLAFSLALAPAPAATTPSQCADFCARARCIGGLVDQGTLDQ